MKITYKPEGSDEPQVWHDWSAGKMQVAHARMIQARYKGLSGEKLPFGQFEPALLQGDIVARHVLLWHLLSLEHKSLRIEDVNFAFDELEVEASLDELRSYRQGMAESRALSEVEKERFLAVMDDEIAAMEAAEADPAQPDGSPGKASSTRSRKSTG